MLHSSHSQHDTNSTCSHDTKPSTLYTLTVFCVHTVTSKRTLRFHSVSRQFQKAVLKQNSNNRKKAIRFISFQKYGWLFPPVLMNTSDLLQLGVFLSADAFFFRVMLSVPWCRTNSSIPRRSRPSPDPTRRPWKHTLRSSGIPCSMHPHCTDMPHAVWSCRHIE